MAATMMESPVASAEDPLWLAMIELFGRGFDLNDPGLAELLKATANHLAAENSGFTLADQTAREVSVDRKALWCGVAEFAQIDHGLDLGWLTRWLQEHGWRPPAADAHRGAQPARAALARGGTLVLSQSMRQRVIPDAARLAGEDSGAGAIALRHLLWVVLKPDPLWRNFDVSADPANWAALRKRLRAWILSRWTSPADRAVWADGEEHPERLATQSDDPAASDRLGRLPFAQVLAERIVEAREAELARPGPNRAFMVHLHGPWGSGKSSILRFLRRELEAAQPRWLTVDFNAWQNQSLRPIWWSIINDVRRQAQRQVDWRTRLKIGLIWWRWKLRADLLPVLIALALFGVAIFGVLGDGLGPDKIFALVTAAIAAGGGVYALSRTVVFGSAHAARAYAELKTDPYTPVIKLFCRLVAAIDRPLLVCVDDVDRCDSGTVVDLLEGIQTLLRDASVTYVVAGDRKWICASFEKRYADFNDKISTPGRPLGYLFLDKLFQVSTAVPRMSTSAREQFWGGLLNASDAGEPRAADLERAEQSVAGLVRQEDLQRRIDQAERPEQRQALRAAAALQITRSAALQESEHRFRSFAGLLERNPRAMKRLVNALGMNQALAFLEGRDVAPEALARWTIVELRWPLLADWLSANSDSALSCCPVPELVDDDDLQAVLGRDGDPGRLDAAMLRLLHE